MCVEQEGGGVAQFKHPHVAHGVHVFAHLKRQLFHLVFGVDDVACVQEFVQDRGEVLHGFEDQKLPVKIRVVRYVLASLDGPLLKGFASKGEFEVAMKLRLGHGEQGV